MPCSGPRLTPVRRSASAAAASARARSVVTVMNAFSRGLSRAMPSRASSTSDDAETSPERSLAAVAAMVGNVFADAGAAPVSGGGGAMAAGASAAPRSAMRAVACSAHGAWRRRSPEARRASRTGTMCPNPRRSASARAVSNQSGSIARPDVTLGHPAPGFTARLLPSWADSPRSSPPSGRPVPPRARSTRSSPRAPTSSASISRTARTRSTARSSPASATPRRGRAGTSPSCRTCPGRRSAPASWSIARPSTSSPARRWRSPRAISSAAPAACRRRSPASPSRSARATGCCSTTAASSCASSRRTARPRRPPSWAAARSASTRASTCRASRCRPRR